MKKAGNYWIPDGEFHLEPFYAAGGWHLDRLERALEYVKNFRVAVDGGAHAGSWTKVMAARFEHVHSFDLTPENFECLAQNITDWGLENVTLYNYGLGDEHELVSVADDPKWEGNTGGKHVAGPGELPIRLLDELELEVLDFLKLDIEGYEEKAMRGGIETITRCKPLILIEHKARINVRYGGANDDVKYLTEIGYKKIAAFKSDVLFGPK